MTPSRLFSARQVMAFHRATGLGVMEAKRVLEDVDSSLRARLLQAVDNGPTGNYFRDPTELVTEFEEAFQQAEQLTNERLKHETHRIGFCHLYWSTKQKILREEFGIEWYTPAQMNPGTYLD